MRLFIMIVDVIGIYIGISMISCTIGFDLANESFNDTVNKIIEEARRECPFYSPETYEKAKKILIAAFMMIFGPLIFIGGLDEYLGRRRIKKLEETIKSEYEAFKHDRFEDE